MWMRLMTKWIFSFYVVTIYYWSTHTMERRRKRENLLFFQVTIYFYWVGWLWVSKWDCLEQCRQGHFSVKVTKIKHSAILIRMTLPHTVPNNMTGAIIGSIAKFIWKTLRNELGSTEWLFSTAHSKPTKCRTEVKKWIDD